jgi:hypothetical protein
MSKPAPLNDFLLVDMNDIPDDTTAGGIVITGDKPQPGLAKGKLVSCGPDVPAKLSRAVPTGTIIWFRVGVNFRPVGGSQTMTWVQAENVFGYST